MLLTDRRLLTAVILNILNLLDLALTLIATQIPHIDFIKSEKNILFVSAYIRLSAGFATEMILLSLMKLIIVLFFSYFWCCNERYVGLALFFGAVFSVYSVVSINWIAIIVQAQPMSPLAINCMLVLLFVVSFFIYYSPSELKGFLKKTTGQC